MDAPDRITEIDYEDFSKERSDPPRRIGDTLYSKYVFERLRADVLENEHGFIVYNFNVKDIFIIEFYISERSRYQGNGRKLLYELYKKAQSNGSSNISANIFLADKNSSETLNKALSCGFKVSQAINNCITIYREVE